VIAWLAGGLLGISLWTLYLVAENVRANMRLLAKIKHERWKIEQANRALKAAQHRLQDPHDPQ
jgi:hypothetical protein